MIQSENLQMSELDINSRGQLRSQMTVLHRREVMAGYSGVPLGQSRGAGRATMELPGRGTSIRPWDNQSGQRHKRRFPLQLHSSQCGVLVAMLLHAAPGLARYGSVMRPQSASSSSTDCMLRKAATK